MMVSDLHRRSAVRLAGILAALFAVAVCGLVAILYWRVGIEIEQRIRARVMQTRDALVEIGKQNGFEDIQAAVDGEASSVRDADILLLLKDAKGDFAAGNIEDAAVFEGWRVLDRRSLPDIADKGDPDDRFFAVWTSVYTGRLLVGVSDREIREARSIMLHVLGWGLVSMLALTTFAGVILARRSQRKIDRLSATLAAVAKGDVRRRVPLSGERDDLEQVGALINDTLQQLERLIESVNHSAAVIAHDLKMPIGRLRQRLDTARRSTANASELKEEIGGAIAEADSIVDTFEAMLQITQLEAGARKARFRTIDLLEVLVTVAEIYEPVAEDAGHRLARAASGPPVAIHGDRELLIQVFANLVENAIRHCPQPTTITIGLDRTPEGPVASVADGGPGIPEHERQNVFQRLYRLEKARSTPGSGLGLTLVAAVCELHKASIELTDAGPGLKVSVRFPVFEQARYTGPAAVQKERSVELERARVDAVGQVTR